MGNAGERYGPITCLPKSPLLPFDLSLYTNTIYIKIEIKPAYSIDYIDHFELYLNGIRQKKIIPQTDYHFSLDGLDLGRKYTIHTVAYPKACCVGAEPISSNTRVSANTFNNHFCAVGSFDQSITYFMSKFTKLLLV